MALQIANPVVVAKVERLAKATGLTKTAVVAPEITDQPDSLAVTYHLPSRTQRFFG
jgi:hypothetical protein